MTRVVRECATAKDAIRQVTQAVVSYEELMRPSASFICSNIELQVEEHLAKNGLIQKLERRTEESFLDGERNSVGRLFEAPPHGGECKFPYCRDKEDIELPDSSNTDSGMKKEDRRTRRTKEKSNRRGSCTDDETTDHEDDNETLSVMNLVNSFHTDALDYRVYRLVNRYYTYHDRVASKILKMQTNLQVQMRDQVFDALDPITILTFLNRF